MDETFRWTKKHATNYGRLMGKEIETPVEQAAPRLIQRSINTLPKPPSENLEQIRYVKWLRANNILAFHVPNGVYKSLRQRTLFRALGQLSGVYDIFICHPSNLCLGEENASVRFCGAFIELKRTKGGTVSATQKAFGQAVIQNGYFAAIAYGCDDAIMITKKYLGMS